MSELIADLPYRIVDPGDQEFYVSVAAEPRTDGRWEAWLEYVPLGDMIPLLTPIETTQPTRAAVERWAATLTETYVQGAFERAVVATSDMFRSRVVTRRAASHATVVPVAKDLPDPFTLFQTGTVAMRARLSTLSRAVLLDIIAAYGLNPAGKSLVWLSDRQLVTFIVTAVEAQLASGKR